MACILVNRISIDPGNGLSSSHYNDVIVGAIASQITSLTIAYSTVYLDTHQRKHQSSASLAFVRGIHRSPLNSPAQMAVTRKIFPFDDVVKFDGNLLRLCTTTDGDDNFGDHNEVLGWLWLAIYIAC